MFTALLATATASGCSAPGPSASSSQPAASAEPSAEASGAPIAPSGTIVFDMAHDEVFAPEDQSRLGQTSVVRAMNDAGYGVLVNRQTITPALLDNVAAVYVPGPMRPFTDEEKTALDDYLERGGTVVLSIHVPFPVLSTPARWGLPVGTGVMKTMRPIEEDPGVFVATGVSDSPLTTGVDDLLVVSGWSVGVDKTKLASASLVVTSGPDVYVDQDEDGQLSAADPPPPFGVVGVAPVGSGRVVVLGDDAVFANMTMEYPGNRRLLDNILELISAPKGA